MRHGLLRGSRAFAGLACASFLCACASARTRSELQAQPNTQADAGSAHHDDAAVITVMDAGTTAPAQLDADTVAPRAMDAGDLMPADDASVPPPTMPPPRCGNGETLLIFSQSQLDELKGCTTIDGSLRIAAAEISNLDALSSCETINGELIISLDLEQLDDDDPVLDTAGVQLKSLAGLSNLRHAAKVILHGLPIATLKDLSALRSVTDLVLHQLDLTDLRGIEQLTWRNLRIARNVKLQSLQGLGPAEHDAGVVLLKHLPELRDLTGLRADQLYGLYISDCASLKDLSGPQGLTAIHSLIVSDCAQFATTAGLAATGAAASITLANDPVLQSITGVLNLHQDFARVDLNNLPALKTLDGLAGLVKADSLIARRCDVLSDLTGLSSLQDINHLEISACGAFKSLAGADALERVNEVFQLEALPAFAELQGLPQLRAAGVVRLKELPQLASISGAPKLSAIGSLEILGDVGLQNLHGLEQLQSINGDLLVEGTRKLKSLQGVTLIELASSLTVRNNAMLVDLKGLEQVKTVWQFTIEANPMLASLTGLEALTHVGSFTITSNKMLANLRALTSLLEIPEPVTIDGNSRLAQCEIEWLAKRAPFEVPPLGSNGPVGMCEP